MSNRKARRALAAEHPTYWRIIPLFQTDDGKLEDGVQTYVMHTEPADVVIATLPARTTSVEHAQRVERELMAKLGKDVIVTTDNVRFMRVEMVDRKEMTRLLKGTS